MGCGCNKTPCGCSSASSGHPRPADPGPPCDTGGFPGGGPCRKNPCECGRGQPGNPCEPDRRCTLCDLYVPGTPNVWVERGYFSPDLFTAGVPDYSVTGICALDTLKEHQIINIIERDDRARADLLKVTSDPYLRKLALTVPKLPTQELVDAEQLNQNRPNEPSSIPFYAIFRGQPPFAQ
jgi:hypothetical protein